MCVRAMKAPVKQTRANTQSNNNRGLMITWVFDAACTKMIEKLLGHAGLDHARADHVASYA